LGAPNRRSIVRDLRSYVVKVYRQQGGIVAGTVQEVRSGRTVPFQTMEELWQAVRTTTPNSGPGPSEGRRAKRAASGKPKSSESDKRDEKNDEPH
jgi:hypothetical protein